MGKAILHLQACSNFFIFFIYNFSSSKISGDWKVYLIRWVEKRQNIIELWNIPLDRNVNARDENRWMEVFLLQHLYSKASGFNNIHPLNQVSTKLLLTITQKAVNPHDFIYWKHQYFFTKSWKNLTCGLFDFWKRKKSGEEREKRMKKSWKNLPFFKCLFVQIWRRGRLRRDEMFWLKILKYMDGEESWKR